MIFYIIDFVTFDIALCALILSILSLLIQLFSWLTSRRGVKASETMADLALQQAKEKPTPWKLEVIKQGEYLLTNVTRICLSDVRLSFDVAVDAANEHQFELDNFPADIDPGSTREFVAASTLACVVNMVTVAWCWPDGEQGSWTTQLL